MELSLAPLEGITNYIFRNLQHEMFGGVDSYYAPFIAPDGGGKYNLKHQKDLLPENNQGIRLVPQILVNAARPFLAVAKELEAMGYKEVNLNAGCPSGTVVSKHKGAGMLTDLKSLDSCLEQIFFSCEAEVSIKTRMGVSSTEEFGAILEVYNKYPIKRLIIHARDRAGMYKSLPDLNGFEKHLPDIKATVEYNGNLFSLSDYDRLNSRFPSVDAYMLGRGAITNPALFRELKGGKALELDELKCFHDRLLDASLESGLSPHYALSHMKELWYYWHCKFPECKKELKAINKSKNLADYNTATAMLFSNCEFCENAAFIAP